MTIKRSTRGRGESRGGFIFFFFIGGPAAPGINKFINCPRAWQAPVAIRCATRESTSSRERATIIIIIAYFSLTLMVPYKRGGVSKSGGLGACSIASTAAGHISILLSTMMTSSIIVIRTRIHVLFHFFSLHFFRQVKNSDGLPRLICTACHHTRRAVLLVPSQDATFKFQVTLPLWFPRKWRILKRIPSYLNTNHPA